MDEDEEDIFGSNGGYQIQLNVCDKKVRNDQDTKHICK